MNLESLRDTIKEAVKQVDDRLLILELTRTGNWLFAIYDLSIGMPTSGERFYVLCRGSGRPKQFDNGGPLPDNTLEVWSGGWGITPITVPYGEDSETVVQKAVNAGRNLVVAVDEQRVSA